MHSYVPDATVPCWEKDQQHSRGLKKAYVLVVFSRSLRTLISMAGWGTAFPQVGTRTSATHSESTKRGDDMTKHTRITRRQFMAGTVAAGVAFVVPWHFESRRALAFAQSIGLQKFI